MTERILVTGGSGLLGSYILRWLRDNGYQNLTATYQSTDAVIPADLKNGIDWKKLILPDIPDAYDIVAEKDWVIHAAALVSYLKEDKYTLLEINKVGTSHIVNAAIAHDVKHFIYISSIAALGKGKNNITLTESDSWLQNQYSTSYGLSKHLGEVEAWRGAAEGMNVSVILPSIILGTGDWSRSSLQIIDRVVNKAPYYPGGQTGYVDVRDIARFIGILLTKNMTGDRWILNGANLSYKDLYHLIATHLSLKKDFQLAPEWQARLILLTSNIKTGRFTVPDIINQVYATFSYDSSKSKTVEGFSYTPIDETIAFVTNAYRSRERERMRG